MVSQMRESRMRMREEELSRQQNQSTSTQPRNSSSQSRSHPRSATRPGRPLPLGPSSRMVEIRSLSPGAPSHLTREEPFLIAEDPASTGAVRGEAISDRMRPPCSLPGTRNTISHSRHSNDIFLRSDPPAPSTNDTGTTVREGDVAQSSALVLVPRRNQRTFARPWRFQDIYSDWSLASIHRIFWLSVACIHIGIFLLFLGGFFHKSPSGLASSLVSLGIFILSTGLAMYTLAKSIIKARARQCQRVLQVVLDLVDPQNGERENERSQNRDGIVGVVDAPPPYEAPPPYPGDTPADPPANENASDCVIAVGAMAAQSVSSNSNKKNENTAHPAMSCLPPTYSRIDIPEETNCDPIMRRGDLPPAYSERP